MRMLTWPLLFFVLLLPGMQTATQGPNPEGVPSCSDARCRGKRVGHWLEQFKFCVPRGLKFRRIVGFEGDIHDRITLPTHGELSELIMFTANFTWGPVKTRPDDWPSSAATTGNTTLVRDWQCSEGRGQDFRLNRDDRNWRLVTFPKGFAEYKNVPAKAARKFDRVLDSLCCQRIALK